MRIVLDTNIFVSALISPGGKPARVVAAAMADSATVLVTSRAQLHELRVALKRRRVSSRLPPGAAEELLNNLEDLAELATDLPPVDITADPKDNLILATAIAGRADLLVSGDKRHMLDLGQIEGIPIVTVAVAARRLLT